MAKTYKNVLFSYPSSIISSSLHSLHSLHSFTGIPRSLQSNQKTSTTVKMQFTTTTLIAILSALAVASPIEPRQNATAQQERLCTSAIDTAMCCQTTLAGVINQTCTTRMFYPNLDLTDDFCIQALIKLKAAITPINKQAFRAYCAAQGQDSSCCKTPLVGDGVICTPP